jgi:hypothetical protein
MVPTLLAGRWQQADVVESEETQSWNGLIVPKATRISHSAGTIRALLDIPLTNAANPNKTGLNGLDGLPDTDDDLPTGTLEEAITKVTSKLDSLGYNPATQN